MSTQIERIKAKLNELRKLDKSLLLFGSTEHKYKLYPPATELQIKRFEVDNQIILPKEYVEFLTQVGDGGAGPFYGLEPLGDSLYDDLDYKRTDGLLNPSKSFIHNQAWNMDFTPSADYDDAEEEYENELAQFEAIYYDDK